MIFAVLKLERSTTITFKCMITWRALGCSGRRGRLQGPSPHGQAPRLSLPVPASRVRFPPGLLLGCGLHDPSCGTPSKPEVSGQKNLLFVMYIATS